MNGTAPDPGRLALGRPGTHPAAGVDPEVIDALGTAASELIAATDVAGVGAAAALRIVAPARRAGITVRDAAGTLVPVGGTDDVVTAIGELQAETGEGPDVDALDTGTEVVVHDLGGCGARWPRLAARASFLDVRSLVAVPLLTAPRRLTGVLTVYADQPSAFGPDDVLAARLLAQHVALALVAAEERQGLHRALDTRDLIGQAKGVLMRTHGITADEAFARLTESSQSTNLKLVTVAEWVVGNLARGA